MPPKKRSEEELGTMLRNSGHWVYKGRDRSYLYCPECHERIEFCPHCEEEILFDKAKTMPDFLAARDWFYIECKQGGNNWSILDVTPTQYKVMNNHAATGGEGYLFLGIGDGRAPKGRAAYLIEWKTFIYAQKDLLQANFKSIRFSSTERSKVPTADEVFGEWKLEWENGSWSIPTSHPFWQARGG